MFVQYLELHPRYRFLEYDFYDYDEYGFNTCITKLRGRKGTKMTFLEIPRRARGHPHSHTIQGPVSSGHFKAKEANWTKWTNALRMSSGKVECNATTLSGMRPLNGPARNGVLSVRHAFFYYKRERESEQCFNSTPNKNRPSWSLSHRDTSRTLLLQSSPNAAPF